MGESTRPWLRSVMLMGSAILMFGCKFDFGSLVVRSLRPLYTDETVHHDGRLIGRWKEEGSDEIWEFSRPEGENGYTCVVLHGDGKRTVLEAHLVTIKGNIFLDLFLSEPDSSQSLFTLMHLLPVHTFASVARIDSTLDLKFPDPDWLGKVLKKEPDTIRHELLEGSDYILSASTEALQQFWLEHLDTEDAYMEPIQLQRIAEHSP